MTALQVIWKIQFTVGLKGFKTPLSPIYTFHNYFRFLY